MAYCIKSHRNRLQQGDKARKSNGPLSPADRGLSCERARGHYRLPIGGRAAKEQRAIIPFRHGVELRKSKEPLSPADRGSSCERVRGHHPLPTRGRAANEQIAAIPFQLENELQKRMSHDRLPTEGQDAASKASSSASQPAAVSNPNPTKQNSATAPNGSRRMFSPIRQCAYWMMITNPGGTNCA